MEHPFPRKEAVEPICLGQPTYLKPKRRRGQEHVGKAGDEEASQAVALQDPRGMVRATLLEVQPWLVHSRPTDILAIAVPPCATESSGAGKKALKEQDPARFAGGTPDDE